MGCIFRTKSGANLLDAGGGTTGQGNPLPEGASAFIKDNVGQRTHFYFLSKSAQLSTPS